MELHYDRTQVQQAAKFIWLNNPCIKDWPTPPHSPLDIVDQILAQARRMAIHNTLYPHDWLTSIGTGGFMIVCTSGIDDTCFDIEVYIDASVKDDPIYVNEDIDYLTLD